MTQQPDHDDPWPELSVRFVPGPTPGIDVGPGWVRLVQLLDLALDGVDPDYQILSVGRGGDGRLVFDAQPCDLVGEDAWFSRLVRDAGTASATTCDQCAYPALLWQDDAGLGYARCARHADRLTLAADQPESPDPYPPAFSDEQAWLILQDQVWAPNGCPPVPLDTLTPAHIHNLGRWLDRRAQSIYWAVHVHLNLFYPERLPALEAADPDSVAWLATTPLRRRIAALDPGPAELPQ